MGRRVPQVRWHGWSHLLCSFVPCQALQAELCLALLVAPLRLHEVLDNLDTSRNHCFVQ